MSLRHAFCAWPSGFGIALVRRLRPYRLGPAQACAAAAASGIASLRSVASADPSSGVGNPGRNDVEPLPADLQGLPRRRLDRSAILKTELIDPAAHARSPSGSRSAARHSGGLRPACMPSVRDYPDWPASTLIRRRHGGRAPGRAPAGRRGARLFRGPARRPPAPAGSPSPSR